MNITTNQDSSQFNDSNSVTAKSRTCSKGLTVAVLANRIDETPSYSLK
jgi:hypothetical protein